MTQHKTRQIFVDVSKVDLFLFWIFTLQDFTFDEFQCLVGSLFPLTYWPFATGPCRGRWHPGRVSGRCQPWRPRPVGKFLICSFSRESEKCSTVFVWRPLKATKGHNISKVPNYFDQFLTQKGTSFTRKVYFWWENQNKLSFFPSPLKRENY